MKHHLHYIAAAKGVIPGLGSTCTFCGPSPYPASNYSLGTLFTDHDYLVMPGYAVCTGCESVVGGKPSATDPPIRMTHIWTDGIELRRVKPADIREVLMDPPPGEWVLSWATSGQRHHALRAGVSTAGRMLVGSDAGQIEVLPEHRDVLVACESLMATFTRDEVLTGAYPAGKVSTFGAGSWAELDDLVSPYRGTLLLDFLVMAARRPDASETTTEDEAMTEIEAAAVRLLYPLAQGSTLRAKDGIAFWRSQFVSRLKETPWDQPVADALDRLARRLLCSPMSLADALEAADELAPILPQVIRHIDRHPTATVARVFSYQRQQKAAKETA